jgi:hypothetical protein
VPPKGEELPNKGKELPSTRTRQERARDYAGAIAQALKEELARGVSIKTIMAWTGAGERTVKGWLGGSNGPSGGHLEGLLRSSELVYLSVTSRVDRTPAVNRQSLMALRSQIADLAEAIEAALLGNLLDK